MVPHSRALRGTVSFILLLAAPAEFLTIIARTRNFCVTFPLAPAMCMTTAARIRKTLGIYARTINALILCLLPSLRRKHLINKEIHGVIFLASMSFDALVSNSAPISLFSFSF